jgi:uncharacterized membrane protein
MEFITFLLLVAILIVIITFKNGVQDRLTKLEREIIRLRDSLGNIKPAEKPQLPITPPPVAQQPLVKPMPIPQPQPPKPVVQEVKPVVAPQVVTRAPRPPKPGFFEKHPDLEKFIGENLVSKIGIAILVLAIGFFVKYAIDNDWIGPIGRVGIGLLCGGILVSVAHYLRNSYKAFSSVLIGGGLAVFYFTISLAYHQFHLFSQTVSFIIMIIITAFAVILSMLYDRQELAIIALVGGFITPFMVSNGSGNYKALFIYLLVLNVGLLFIAFRKAWRLLNLLAFVFTAILFVSWIVNIPGKTSAVTYKNGLLFATLFYILFFIINIAHNIREKKKFIASDFGILLANTCLYFTVGLYFLTAMHAEEYRGLFCIAMGIFNLGSTYFLFRKSKVDNNILYLLIAITLTFISLAAPIQLNGNNITLFWASESVLLYWLFQKSKIKIIQVSSMIIWVCMIISLMMDIIIVYEPGAFELNIIFNKGFITTLYAAAATYALFLLRRRDVMPRTGLMPGKEVFRIIALVLLYAAGFFEINYQFLTRFTGPALQGIYNIFYTLTFIAVIIFIAGKVSALKISKQITAGLLIFGIVIYLLQIRYSFLIQQQMLVQQVHKGHFIIHWLTAIVTGILIYQLITLYRSLLTDKNEWQSWLIAAITIIFVTAEVHLLSNTIFYIQPSSIAGIQGVFIKAGWPILWGLSSFAFMWLGMRYKFRTLRIISLTLFMITLLKLFIYDIVNIPVGGKIAAFFSLGVLLLVVSFMYQRLKKIIIDEETVIK